MRWALSVCPTLLPRVLPYFQSSWMAHDEHHTTVDKKLNLSLIRSALLLLTSCWIYHKSLTQALLPGDTTGIRSSVHSRRSTQKATAANLRLSEQLKKPPQPHIVHKKKLTGGWFLHLIAPDVSYLQQLMGEADHSQTAETKPCPTRPASISYFLRSRF